MGSNEKIGENAGSNAAGAAVMAKYSTGQMERVLWATQEHNTYRFESRVEFRSIFNLYRNFGIDNFIHVKRSS